MNERRSFRASFVLVAICTLFAATWGAQSAHANPHNDYMLQCQGCHMADGSGAAESVPDLRNRLGLFLGVEDGREFLIRVPGSAQSPLSNHELAEVLNWMVRNFGPAEVGASFAPFTEAEVERHRKPLADVEPVRTVLMERITAGKRERVPSK
ncbi:MAG: cytochrome c [Deltaproteobacteria bacterium]|nr:cytochrome c [Deltaproteobacteria bacterium]